MLDMITFILLICAALCFLRSAFAAWFNPDPKHRRPDFTSLGFFFVVFAVLSILYAGGLK